MVWGVRGGCMVRKWKWSLLAQFGNLRKPETDPACDRRLVLCLKVVEAAGKLLYRP